MLDILLELFQIVPSFPTLCSLPCTSRLPSWFSQEMAMSLVDTLHPLRLFHGFLSMIAYDHLVLVDYLISADTGSRFLRYLLQHLTLAVNSWPSILQSANPVTTDQSKSSSFLPVPLGVRSHSHCTASVSPLSCTESLSSSRIQDRKKTAVSGGGTICSADEDSCSTCGTSVMVEMEENLADLNTAKLEVFAAPRDDVISLKIEPSKQPSDGEAGQQGVLRKRGRHSEERYEGHNEGRFEVTKGTEFVKSIRKEVLSEVGCGQTGGCVGRDLCNVYKNDEEHLEAVESQGHLPGSMSKVKSNEGLKQDSSSVVGKEGGRIPRTPELVRANVVAGTLSREGEKSMKCLQALRKTLERVHRGGLFPYNPTALVRRLLALEGLWIARRGV